MHFIRVTFTLICLLLPYCTINAKGRGKKILKSVLHFVTTPPSELLFSTKKYEEPAPSPEDLQKKADAESKMTLEDAVKTFDVPKIRAHLAQLSLAPTALKLIEAELDKCAAAGTKSDYLAKLLAIPWDKKSTDNLDLENAKAILDEYHYGLETVKENILDFIARLQFAPQGRAPILCLVGPPGVGKTTLCKPIAKALGRSYVHKALGGQWGEHALRGFHRTFMGSQPGAMVEALIEAGTMNPIIVLDEIDKLGSNSHHGDPSAALLEILDPAQNSMFRDNYLEVPLDLSKVFFIVTANDRSHIPEALQSRLHIIEIPGYTIEEKIIIAQRHLIPQAISSAQLDNEELLREKGFNPALIKIQFTRDALIKLATDYSYEYGVRKIKQHLETIVSKTMRKLLLAKNKATFSLEPIDAKTLVQLLGNPE